MAGEGAKAPGGKRTFSLATKLMFAFLALSLVAFACIGYLSIYTMNGIEATAEENSDMLGKLAVNDSITALQQLGESAIKEKTLDVAEEVRIFLE